MKDEIAAAVVFLTELLKKQSTLTTEQVKLFQVNLSSLLLDRFRNHWDQDRPTKGQGYRCIRINETEPVDPVLEAAAKNTGVRCLELGLPNEFTLWVDPKEVSCRLGENYGCYALVAQFKDGNSENLAKSPDIDRLLANHLERRESDRAKFRLATTTRSNHREISPRSSPPMYGYEPNPHTYYGSQVPMGWDQGYPIDDGYHGNHGWGNWAGDGSQAPQPKKSHHKHHRSSSRPANFSNHPSDRVRWGKDGGAAKA